MRLFLYYAVHSIKNGLKKLFKTWVLVVFLVFMLGGAAIGLIAGSLLSKGEDPTQTEAPVEAEEEPVELPMEAMDLAELAVGAVIVLFFTFSAMGAAKKGAEIFQPADAALLFPSPLKPQSVLLFRTVTQMGASIVASLYLVFQLPNLLEKTGLGLSALPIIMVGLAVTACAAQLSRVALYVCASRRPFLKNNLKYLILGVLGLVGLGFYLFMNSQALPLEEALPRFFNGPISRMVPFWGWIKGFILYALEKNYALMALCLLALILGGGLLGWLIWRMPVDFYEEALKSTSDKAEIMEAVSAEGKGIIQRKKDRSDRIRRNALNRGWGASVFLHKALYNRFRFGHLGFLSKTLEFYLVVCVGIGLLCRFVSKNSDSDYLLMVGCLALLSFYRSLGNSLQEDTKMWYFHLIPETPFRKLAYSLGGDMANCTLDVVPSLVLGLLIMGAPMGQALLWLPAILSVTAYSTAVGAFIDMSVNTDAGKMLKGIVQMIFLYFGLLPVVGAALPFLLMDMPLAAALAVTLLNLGLTALFIFFASLTMGRSR